MPLRTLIVDDERLAREELCFLLSQTPAVEICGQGTNGIEAVQLIRETEPDLVFLDVKMPGLDGFGVLKKLVDRREKRARLPRIVFATAYDQYAVRAFEVNAVDYLLKPFDRKRVLQAVDRARQAQDLKPAASEGGSEALLHANLEALLRLLGPGQEATARPRGRIALRSAGRLVLVDQKDICFATIAEGAITVATPTVEGEANHRTLDDLLEGLDPAIFWRNHRSFLVNINHIREVVPWFKSSYQLRMNDRKHSEIPVSRAQTRKLREMFNL